MDRSLGIGIPPAIHVSMRSSSIGRIDYMKYLHCAAMIQVDIGGHLPSPPGPPPLSFSAFSVFLIVAQLTIFSSFSGPELPEPF